MTTPDLDLPDLGGRISLRERITASLRAALVSGQMIPGVVYSVPMLAERFGVSATPVREAMLDLVNEGIVEPVPNKGFRVVEMAEADLDDITEVRRLLEVPTVVALCGHVTDAEAEPLRRMAEGVRVAAAEGDVLAYLAGDREFHLALVTLSGNARLVDLVDRLRAQTRLYGLTHLAESGRLVESAEEHLGLLDAVLAGDADEVERVMNEHLDHVRGSWAGFGDE